MSLIDRLTNVASNVGTAIRRNWEYTCADGQIMDMVNNVPLSEIKTAELILDIARREGRSIAEIREQIENISSK